MTAAAARPTRVPTYCYQCVAGPDLLTVRVENGVATDVEPNFCAAEVHPGGGKVCVKAYGLVQKTYNPNRILAPCKRTNPKKGRDQDPGFVPISWDEALDTIAAQLNRLRAEGLTDASGYPRLAASFGAFAPTVCSSANEACDRRQKVGSGRCVRPRSRCCHPGSGRHAAAAVPPHPPPP